MSRNDTPVVSHWLADRGRAPFTNFLQEFDLSALDRAERDAGFQGIVYAYMRIECPDSQIEWRTRGAKSLASISLADLCTFDASTLFVAVQVRAQVFLSSELPSAAAFARSVAEHDAAGLVAAFNFEADSRGFLNALRLNTISIADLVERSRLWDTSRQKCAAQALLFFLGTHPDYDVTFDRVHTFLHDALS